MASMMASSSSLSEDVEMECMICCETFNKCHRMKIACSNCRYTSCRQCVKMYLLGSSLEPSCMNCKFAWNAEFIRTVMPKSFVDGEYKTHRWKMLL